MLRVADSKDSFPEELNIFYTPPTQSAYEKIQWVDYRPIAPLKEDAAVEFTIPASGAQYLNLKQTLLNLKFKVVKENGTEVDLDDKVAPANLILHTLFSQVEVFLQQKLINPSNKNYSYKAMLETLLTYDTNAKSTQLQASGYYKDTAMFMDDPQPLTGGNTGLKERYNLVSMGKTCDLIGPLHHDFFQQDRLLINGVELQLKLWSNRNAFVLTTAAAEKYKIIITDCILKVCKVTLSPGLSLAQAEQLAVTPALYPYEETRIKNFNITQGSYNFRIEDIFQGAIPTRIVLAMVKAEAYNGSYKLNPYNFIHSNCSSIACFVDDESVPAQPLHLRFQDNNYISAYYSLFTGMCKDSLDCGNAITREDYDSGYSIFVLEILPVTFNRFGTMEQFPLIRRGNFKIDIQFQEALDENVTLIAMGKFPAIVQIDNTRNVII